MSRLGYEPAGRGERDSESDIAKGMAREVKDSEPRRQSPKKTALTAARSSHEKRTRFCGKRWREAARESNVPIPGGLC